MKQNQKKHQSKQVSRPFGDENSALNFCQRRLNKEAELLRQKTQRINKQIAQKEMQLFRSYKKLRKTTDSKDCARASSGKKSRICYPLIKTIAQSSLFQDNRDNKGISIFSLSGIKRLIFRSKMSASDKLIEMIVQNKQRTNGLAGTNVIEYISAIAQQLEAVIDRQDRLARQLKTKHNNSASVCKMHRYARLIRYVVVFIIELIRLAEANDYLIPVKLDDDSQIHAIYNMLIHAYPQAAWQNSIFSVAEIAQVHNHWARQFVAFRNLHHSTQGTLELSKLPLKYKLVIPGESAGTSEQRLWKFYLSYISRHAHQWPSPFHRIEIIQDYIRSTLPENMFADLTETQSNARKLDWCFIIADIGEVIQQCPRLAQSQFHKTISIRNYFAHAQFNAVSLEDVRQAVVEINTILVSNISNPMVVR